MFFLELVIRCESEVVCKLYDGIQFVELVLQRRARQDDGIVGFYFPCRPRNLCVPVFQPLHLVHDEHVGL